MISSTDDRYIEFGKGGRDFPIDYIDEIIGSGLLYRDRIEVFSSIGHSRREPDIACGHCGNAATDVEIDRFLGEYIADGVILEWRTNNAEGLQFCCLLARI